MRQYEPVWLEIKLNGFCNISAHRAYHKRIVKAITKEKDMDLGYKLECTEAYPPIRTLLYHKREGSIIKFRLVKKPLITLDSI